MSLNSTFYQQSTSNSSTSTLRPRNARLISYIEDEASTSAPQTEIATSSATNTPPKYSSRNVSPFGVDGSRARSIGNKDNKGSITQLKNKANNQTHTRAVSENRSTRAEGTASTGGLWDSWSSIQGIASTFLGSDVSSADGVRRSSSARKAGPVSKRDRAAAVYSTRTTGKWGPPTSSGKNVVATADSTIEDRQALVQAKKREALLAANGEQHVDSLGRYKRKGSNVDRASVIAAFTDDDALVYKHNVLPNDTMAGVIIKYGCQPEVFRKVNRFWPNDNIQRKRHVLLPVDACSVKGRRVDDPDPLDLLGPELSKSNGQTSEPTTHSVGDDFDPFSERKPSIAVIASPLSMASPLKNSSELEESYRHDSWAQLPGFLTPTQILRLSKRGLGYFPPARRKSGSTSHTPFSDTSTTSTPKSSFDMLRHPPTHAAQQALQNQLSATSLNASPVRPSLLGARNRSSSTTSAPSSSATSFVTVLQGPGGVGTLRGLRTELARPGPAEDPLNKKFAQYIPDLLPPTSELDDLGRLSVSHSRTASSSLASRMRKSPRASMDTVRSGRSSRSNSAAQSGGIEGWIRRMGSSGAPGVIGSKSPMRKRGEGLRLDASDVGAVLSGDLIELSDATPNEERQGNLFDDLTPRATSMPVKGLGSDGAGTSGGGGLVNAEEGIALAVDDETLMNERFPVRGRVRRAYEAD